MNKSEIMDIVRTIELKESIIKNNDADADKLRAELNERGVFYVNVMSAPGSGKTTLLVALTKALQGRCKVGVMEADIDGDVDAYTMREAGAEAIQLHTGGMCHLDADMSRQGFKEFATTADIVFLENIGNLVCPAEFDTGAHLKIVLLALPEGDDKPLKYSLMFSVADAVAFTKSDTAKYFDFDVEKCKGYINGVNPNAKTFEVSARTGEGIAAFADYIFGEYSKWKEGLK